MVSNIHLHSSEYEIYTMINLKCFILQAQLQLNMSFNFVDISVLCFSKSLTDIINAQAFLKFLSCMINFIFLPDGWKLYAKTYRSAKVI